MKTICGTLLVLTPGAAWVWGEPSWAVVIYTAVLACLGIVMIANDV